MIEIKKTLLHLAGILMLIFPTFMEAQDDADGINDTLEMNLARKFAPEWRFHIDELYFPTSMKGLIGQTKAKGASVLLKYNGQTKVIDDFNNLDATTLPGTNTLSSDIILGYENKDIALIFPKELPGEPYSFPTFIRCHSLGGGEVAISYLLFYSYDFKATVDLPFPLTYISVWHRGDWEGISVRVSGVNDLTNPDSYLGATIEEVQLEGHGTPRYISSQSPSFSSVNGVHPKIFIAKGSHASFPQSGTWPNLAVDNAPDFFYGDKFPGNGLAVQSWQPSRELINVGEKLHPLVGWLNYAGLWGTRDEGEDHSPGGPVDRLRIWSHNTTGYFSWEQAVQEQNYKDYYSAAFEPICTRMPSQYSPDSGYDCNYFVNCRGCFIPGFGEHSFLSVANQFFPANPTVPTRVGIFPCHFPNPIIFTKPMVLKAIEGPVTIGQ